MRPHKSLLVLIVPFTSLWNLMGPYKCLCVFIFIYIFFMGPYEFLRVLMDFYRSLCVLMGLNGSF